MIKNYEGKDLILKIFDLKKILLVIFLKFQALQETPKALKRGRIEESNIYFFS